MQKTFPVFLLMMILTLNACVPVAVIGTPSLPTIEQVPVVATQIPTIVSPTEVNPTASLKLYTNNAFGLSFQYPSSWFGPGEYVLGETLRVEVGSDKVYPYGERPEQPSDVKNSYNIVIQYTKNNQNSSWKETYQSLLNLKDGESLSGARSLLIRVRQFDLGRFKGFEYITTLPETAKTDYTYGREVILFDEHTNDLITILGQPYNVDVSNAAEWQNVYRTIDDANLIFFHKIVESMTTGK
jgi:hypothetical protein